MADVDRLVLAGNEVVVAGDVRAGVADVAEEGAEWAVVVERQGQRADRAGCRTKLDRHVHRDPELGVDRPLQGVRLHDRRPGLVGEQVDGVSGVVPQEVVGPRPGLPQGIEVLSAEEVGLHVHLLQGELAGGDPAVHPLVARVEAPGVADHPDQAALLLDAQARLGVAQRVGQGDLHLHVLPRRQAGLRLFGVQRRRRREDDGVDVVHREHVVERRDGAVDAVLRGEGCGAVEGARHDGGDLDPVDAVQGRDVLGAERPTAGEGDAERLQGRHVTHFPQPTRSACSGGSGVPQRCSRPARGRSGA